LKGSDSSPTIVLQSAASKQVFSVVTMFTNKYRKHNKMKIIDIMNQSMTSVGGGAEM